MGNSEERQQSEALNVTDRQPRISMGLHEEILEKNATSRIPAKMSLELKKKKMHTSNPQASGGLYQNMQCWGQSAKSVNLDCSGMFWLDSVENRGEGFIQAQFVLVTACF